MSLAEASEARKARLIALRKRKEGQDGDEDGYVNLFMFPSGLYRLNVNIVLYYL